MKQYTVRGIPDKIEKKILEEAKRKGVSINKTVISMLERASGAVGRKRPRRAAYKDLDHLFSVWTSREAERFEGSLELQRLIDEELWKKAG